MELIRSLSSPSGVPVGTCSIWPSLSESDTAKVEFVTEAYQGCFKSVIECQTCLTVIHCGDFQMSSKSTITESPLPLCMCIMKT